MSDGEEISFSINEQYAEKYNQWREKEEKQKLKQRYGDVGDDDDGTDSSSSSSEDEDAEGLTPQVEKGWLKTLAALKARDPRIYDPDVHFYQSDDESGDEESKKKEKKEKKKKEKPMYLKDFEREVMLKKDGKFEREDGDEEDDDDDERQERMPPSYYEEQEEIKKGFKDIVGDSEEEEEEEDLLVKRTKTTEEQQAEESDYLKWLKGQEDNLDEETKVGIEPLKEYWSNPKLSDRDTFLRDYILNKRYIEQDDEELPTYDEIVNAPDEDLDEEEEVLQKQENFEHKYNFRYEEPDAEFIKSYPRTIGDSVRRKDTKRADQRKAASERKEQAKARKKEEIKQLKNMKKREIMSKIAQLKEVTGNEELAFKDADVEGAFNPEEYDAMMQKKFDDDFYEGEEDDDKPVFSDDEDLDGPWDEEGEDYNEEDWSEQPHCEDPDFNMDADYDPNAQPQPQPSTSKKKKGKNKFKDAVKQEKPQFDPSEKTFDEYIEEYYNLDYEDLIGDMPCRFKYREVVPNDFGLTTDEILTAKQAELNRWVSVKKMSQYRTEEEEKFDVLRFKKKGHSKQKLQILPSLVEKPKDKPDDDTKSTSPSKPAKPTQRAGKDKAKKQEDPVGKKVEAQTKPRKRKLPGLCEDDTETDKTSAGGAKKKKKKNPAKEETGQIEKSDSVPKDSNKKSKKKKNFQKKDTISDDRLKAYGINPKKFKYTKGLKK